MHATSYMIIGYYREVGGCMIPIWPQYYDCAHSLLYVINLSQADTLATAVTELQQAVLHPQMQVSFDHT